MADRRDNSEEDNLVDFPSELDPAQFRVAGTDSKGHSTRLWGNFQPMHVQTIDILVQSGKFPYRTRGDFLRHAVIRHIHWLEKFHKPMNSITGAIDAMNALLRDYEFRAEFAEMIGRLTKQVRSLVEEGDTVAARRLLLEALRHVDSMPEGYWKDKYSSKIREENADILADLPKASLRNFSGEGE